MIDVMVDLETWGTRPGCAFRSLGAVFFDPETGQLGDEFYCNISDASCKKLKMHKDPGTIEWWGTADKALANKQLADGQEPVIEVLERFAKFWRNGRGKYFWSQGANFDEPLLSWAFHAAGMEQPWKFYDAQDTRTAYRMGRLNPFLVKRGGTYHNALDDAKHQVVCVSMAHKKRDGKLV
jgi:hypothetical protein